MLLLFFNKHSFILYIMKEAIQKIAAFVPICLLLPYLFIYGYLFFRKDKRAWKVKVSMIIQAIAIVILSLFMAWTLSHFMILIISIVLSMIMILMVTIAILSPIWALRDIILRNAKRFQALVDSPNMVKNLDLWKKNAFSDIEKNNPRYDIISRLLYNIQILEQVFSGQQNAKPNMFSFLMDDVFYNAYMNVVNSYVGYIKSFGKNDTDPVVILQLYDDETKTLVPLHYYSLNEDKFISMFQVDVGTGSMTLVDRDGKVITRLDKSPYTFTKDNQKAVPSEALLQTEAKDIYKQLRPHL